MTLFNHYKPMFGTDPEMFLEDNDGNVIPASAVVGYGPRSNASIIYDNAAVEIRVEEDTCLEYVLENIQNKMGRLARSVRGHDKNLRPDLSPARVIDSDKLESHDGCMEFGCDPSIVYGKDGPAINRPSVSADEINVRSVGFHIHVGGKDPNNLDDAWKGNARYTIGETVHTDSGRLKLTELMDIFVGIPGLLLETAPAKNVRHRRNTLGYGRAGEYREQPHGYEYRTLGSWPMYDAVWAWAMMCLARDVVHFFYNDLEDVASHIDRDDVIDAINNADRALAARIWDEAVRDLKDKMDSIPLEDAPYGNHILFVEKNLARLEYCMIEKGYETMSQGNNIFDNWDSFRHHNMQCFPSVASREISDTDIREKFGDWSYDNDTVLNFFNPRGEAY